MGGVSPDEGPKPIPTLPRVAVPVRYSLSLTPDASKLRFAGKALIDFKLIKATNALVLHSVDLGISSASVSNRRGNGHPRSQGIFRCRRTDGNLHARPANPAGQFRLHVEYTGRIQTHPAGLFALDYESSTGKSRALFTQLEPADARRFLPSWDEPIFRTPFDLQVTIPAHQTVVSNMPVREERLHSDGTKTVAFTSTPAMSTYLLFSRWVSLTGP